ncbi:hypothetical protein BBL94_14625 [Vibrio parahaemolyticus]|nr:hypothetical protein BBL82_20245 [Vibrio parahaemolyticus]ODW49594.1 hypothetical protein BBL87_22295 [Vibrio parahaemolyticus]ODW90655.1 hypothetical protein BBL94_14625 [Vibrio parahaemolyticus]
MFRVNIRVFLAGLSYFNFESFGFVKIVLRFLLWLDFLFQKSICLLKTCSAALPFQKISLVFKVRFLRRCKFQVVSVTRVLKLRLIQDFQYTQGQWWQSCNQLQVKALVLATNKLFKRDSQRLAVLV